MPWQSLAFSWEKWIFENWEKLPTRPLEDLSRKLSFYTLENFVGYKKNKFYFRGLPYCYLSLGNRNNPPLIWLHGFSDNKYTFTPVAWRLKNQYFVIIPDIPGFDDTTPMVEEKYDLDFYTEYTSELIQSLNLGPVTLAGNSLGGGIALKIAAEKPDLLAKVIAVNTAGVTGIKLQGFYLELLQGKNLFHITSYQDFEYFLSRIFYRPIFLPLPVKLLMYRELHHFSLWYNKLMNDLTHGLFGAEGLSEARNWENYGLDKELEKISRKVSIIWGENDSLFPVEIGKYINQKIKSSEFYSIPNCGHCPHLEKPAQLAQLLEKILN